MERHGPSLMARESIFSLSFAFKAKARTSIDSRTDPIGQTKPRTRSHDTGWYKIFGYSRMCSRRWARTRTGNDNLIINLWMWLYKIATSKNRPRGWVAITLICLLTRLTFESFFRGKWLIQLLLCHFSLKCTNRTLTQHNTLLNVSDPSLLIRFYFIFPNWFKCKV